MDRNEPVKAGAEGSPEWCAYGCITESYLNIRTPCFRAEEIEGYTCDMTDEGFAWLIEKLMDDRAYEENKMKAGLEEICTLKNRICKNKEDGKDTHELERSLSETRNRLTCTEYFLENFGKLMKVLGTDID